MHRGLGEPLPHQLANAPRVHPSATPESAFHSYAMRHKLLCGISTCFQVLSPLMGRLPTCYSPVRHSSFQLSASTREERSVRLACIRHAASVRPEPGSNSHNKVRTILRLLSSICLLAYCLLVKNVCCLELNQDALHIWFVYSLFSFQRSTLPRSNFYIITNFRLNVKNFFKKFLSCFAWLLLSVVTTSISYHLVCYLSTTFYCFSNFFERFEIKNCYLIIDF